MILNTTFTSKQGIAIHLLVLPDATLLVTVSLTGRLIVLPVDWGPWEDTESMSKDTFDNPTLSFYPTCSKSQSVDIGHLTVIFGVLRNLL